jgi:tripartite-type tricarboxylate transporter receptor subunit TctC
VENRPGASGAIGTNFVARAAPNGLTLLLARTASSAILPATDPRTPYAWDEFTVLGLLHETPFVVCVQADAPWRRLGDLLGALREAPGRMTFATTGPATILDLGVRQFFVANGLPLDAGTALPFAGGAEAVAAWRRDRRISSGAASPTPSPPCRRAPCGPSSWPGVSATPSCPAFPTAKEAEAESLEAITGWSALFGPASLPAPVVEAWVDAIAALGSDRGWVERPSGRGAVPRHPAARARRGTSLRAQVALYGDLARRLGPALTEAPVARRPCVAFHIPPLALPPNMLFKARWSGRTLRGTTTWAPVGRLEWAARFARRQPGGGETDEFRTWPTRTAGVPAAPASAVSTTIFPTPDSGGWSPPPSFAPRALAR